MKSKVLRVSVVTLLSVGICLAVVKHNANAQAQHVRWDMIQSHRRYQAGRVRIRYSRRRVDDHTHGEWHFRRAGE